MNRKPNSCERWKNLKGKYSVMFEKNHKEKISVNQYELDVLVLGILIRLKSQGKTSAESHLW